MDIANVGGGRWARLHFRELIEETEASMDALHALENSLKEHDIPVLPSGKGSRQILAHSHEGAPARSRGGRVCDRHPVASLLLLRRLTALISRQIMKTARSLGQFVSVILFAFLFADTARSFTLDADVAKLEVAELSYFVEDTPYDQESVLARDEAQWQPIASVNLGYTDDVHWFRFSLNSETDVLRLLQVDYPLLDDITLYHYVGPEIQKAYSTGDRLVFGQRPLQNRNFLFPLQLSSLDSNTIVIRVQTSGALRMPLVLWDEREFHAQDAKENLINALYLGMLIIMAAFNLLLFFCLRDKTYLYYVFFVGSIALLIVSIYGYGFQYLYPRWPDLHDFIILFILPLAVISVCMFTITFFDLRTKNVFWFRVFACFIVTNVLCLLAASVLPYNISIRISVIVAFLVSVGAAIAGAKFWWDGDAGARWFSLAWLLLLLDSVGMTLSRLGIIPSSFLIEQGLPISTILQALLFAVALASRLNFERDARLKAQQEHLFEIRKRREAEHQLVYAAGHSEVTGLPSRLIFEKALRPYIEAPRETRESIAVVLLHVRRFDDVNKTLGHRNADVFLRRIGERIDAVVSQRNDVLSLETIDGKDTYTAHIEGVSFCFTLASADHDSTMADISQLVRKMSEPIEFLGLALELSFIVGCSLVKDLSSTADVEKDPQNLLRQAFIAFDSASKHLSPIAIYEPKMNPYNPRRLTLMTELRSALAGDGLALFFQPQLDLRSGEVSGLEALLRWHHQDYGFVSPDEFIPMAEKTGLMKPLTKWVLTRAVRFIKTLETSSADLKVSVNISALNLRELNFCGEVVSLVRSEGVRPSRLVLEVTETAAMIDPDHAVEALTSLQSADIRLSIDDFGTGHSSLAYIRKLPVHEIKIDRSFISDIAHNKNDATIVKTTINMCHDLGYEVVAEGVENDAAMAILAGIGCDIIQGYHIAKPMSESDTIDWLSARRVSQAQ